MECDRSICFLHEQKQHNTTTASRHRTNVSASLRSQAQRQPLLRMLRCARLHFWLSRSHAGQPRPKALTPLSLVLPLTLVCLHARAIPTASCQPALRVAPAAKQTHKASPQSHPISLHEYALRGFRTTERQVTLLLEWRRRAQLAYTHVSPTTDRCQSCTSCDNSSNEPRRCKQRHCRRQQAAIKRW
jgi:hypothetical protein